MIRFLSLLLMCGSALASAQDEAADKALIDKARAFVHMLAADKFDATPPLMDATMNRALPPDRFRALWKNVQERSGAFNDIADADLEHSSGYQIVHVRCRFEKTTSEFRVVYDRAGLVAGFFLGPSPSNAKPVDPPYADHSTFGEEDAHVGSGEFRLPGTLTLPKSAGPFPVVVLVHGSGPNDRDETIGPNKVFRDVAWGLATRGIASLRYEKRTRAFPKQFDMKTATYREETVDDAIAAVKMVAADARFDTRRVVVLGHSFGGTLAPLIAKETPETTGIALMAGSTEGLIDAILRQTQYIFLADGQLSDTEKSQLTTLQQAAKDAASGKPATGIFAGVPAHYIDALKAYDAAGTAKSLSIPVFVAQGGRDYQVLASGSFADWKKALADHANASFKEYPALDHLFMEGKAPSYPRDYQIPRNVSDEFIGDVAEWVKKLPD